MFATRERSGENQRTVDQLMFWSLARLASLGKRERERHKKRERETERKRKRERQREKECQTWIARRTEMPHKALDS